MTDTPRHTKVTNYTPLPDGSWKRTTKTYFESLADIEEDKIVHHKTSFKTFLEDMLRAAAPIKDGKTRMMSMDIKADEYGVPSMITVCYRTYKESFRKR